MATTPKYSWRIPVAADAPNAPYDMTNLATDIENTVFTGRSVMHASGSLASAPANATNVFWALGTSITATGDAMTLTGGDIRVEKAGFYEIRLYLKFNQAADAFTQTGVYVPSTALPIGALIRPGAFVQASPARIAGGVRFSTAGGIAYMSEEFLPSALTVTSIDARVTVTPLVLT